MRIPRLSLLLGLASVLDAIAGSLAPYAQQIIPAAGHDSAAWGLVAVQSRGLLPAVAAWDPGARLVSTSIEWGDLR